MSASRRFRRYLGPHTGAHQVHHTPPKDETKTMTTIAATVIVALLVVVALARLANIVAGGVNLARSYVDNR